jgi:hypothetical protein
MRSVSRIILLSLQGAGYLYALLKIPSPKHLSLLIMLTAVKPLAMDITLPNAEQHQHQLQDAHNTF